MAGLEVGVLVKNVGVNPVAKFFHAVEEEVLEKMIKVNVEATTRVNHAVLPGMIKRRRGAMVNIGSCASIAVPSHSMLFMPLSKHKDPLFLWFF